MNRKDVRLADNFWLSELCATNHREIDNTPSDKVIENLRVTASEMQKIRHLFGNKVIMVSSGYRCPELNCVVGGAMTRESLLALVSKWPTSDLVCQVALHRIQHGKTSVRDSAHMLGLAADWVCPSFGTPYNCCVRLGVHMNAGFPIDQLIYEGTWVHTGFALIEDNARRDKLTLARDGSYLAGIVNV